MLWHKLRWAALVLWMSTGSLAYCIGLPVSQENHTNGGVVPIDNSASLSTSDNPRQDKPQRIEFNLDFLMGAPDGVDRYTQGNPVLPGIYLVDLSINEQRRGRYDVRFQMQSDDATATPCFSMEQFDKWGIDLSAEAIAVLDGAGTEHTAKPSVQCLSIEDAVPAGQAFYDSSTLALSLSVPQANLRRRLRGYVEPMLWDAGVTVGTVDYNVNAYSSETAGHSSNSIYAGVLSGVNAGGWRFRQRSFLNWGSQGSQVRSIAAYVQTDLTALQSQLTLGDSSTSGNIFDSFSLRGVQLSTDDRMLPDAARGYAPVVHGIAETNARVTVRQGNNIIYQSTVPPGPFIIDDLGAVGYGGDLKVTITETDGRERNIFVPFAAMPQLLRSGVSRFNLTAGTLRDTNLHHSPPVFQAVYQCGLNSSLSAYGGALVSEGYLSGLLGAALNTSYGAVALDGTLAQTKLLDQGTQRGHSVRISYSKLISPTNTNLTMTAYRYSNVGFYSLQDAVYTRAQLDGREKFYDFRIKSRMQLNLAQPLGKRGALYAAGSLNSYWGNNRSVQTQYQIGFNQSLKHFSYNLYAQRSRDVNGNSANQFGINFSIPLGEYENSRPAFNYFAVDMTRSADAGNNLRLNASGSTGEDGAFNYGLNGSYVDGGASRSTQAVGGYGSYNGPKGLYSATASISNYIRQISAGVSGAVVAHAGGVTLSPPLYGSAFALVEAKGAEGARVVNGRGAVIDANGYAVLPSLTEYRINRVQVDPEGLPDDVELQETSAEIVPRASSGVLVKMPTIIGRPFVVVLRDTNGHFLPMGAQLFDEDGKNVGGIGQGGIAFLRGLEGSGRLVAKWGGGANQQCTLPYEITDIEVDADKAAFTRLTLNCSGDEV